jgi:hypothetical protein
VSLGNPPYGAEGVHVRARRDESGRNVITALFIHGPEITAETLRGLSLPRIEAGLNKPGVDPGDEDDSDITVGSLEEQGRKLARQQQDDRDAGVVRGKLRRPDGSDPEAFYRLVASAYGAYSTQTNAPAVAIAEEANVPVTTVHRWVREARRRGFLPPGRKGRAG